MPILAIDTSTTYLSLALHAHGETQLYHAEAGNHQSQHILPRIQALFAQAQIQAADLSAIVYAQGAGAFTGLRIGIGIAQGIATPYNPPLIGIPCQDAVAYQIPNHPCVLAATDARMGEVFYAFFNTQTHQRLSDYQVAKPANIRQPENIPADAVIGIGNAYALASPPPFAGTPQMPTAADYLALDPSKRYPATAPEHAEWLYVRNKPPKTKPSPTCNNQAANSSPATGIASTAK